MPPVEVPLSPRWWLLRLHKQLAGRRDEIEFFDDYYRGAHPLPMIPEKARPAFQKLLTKARTNYMGLVVDATAERLQVDGFRLGDSREGDETAWGIWQANNLDADGDMVLAEALKTGRSFLLVAPNPAAAGEPLITPEHPCQAIVEYVPGNRRQRAAGLKVWDDDWTGRLMATLYLPDGLYKFWAEKPRGSSRSADSVQWQRREVPPEPWPAPNPLGVVPLIEFRNRPDLTGGASSEVSDVTDIQDRINKTIIDRLMAQEFAAFRQRWVTGMEIPEDENGQPVEPFRAAMDRIWMAEDPDTRFGEFGATDLVPYLKAVEQDVKDIASRTRTPSQYLLGEMVNLSGDALKVAESGLVAKVRQRMRPFGESLEETVRLALTAAGDARGANTRTETIWRNPEFRTEGELVAALIQMATIGVPHEALWERWGASQEEIRRWKAMQTDAAARQGIGDVAAFLTGPKPVQSDNPTP